MLKKQANFLYRFNEIIKKYPNNIAVLEDGKVKTTYKDLQENALKVASYISKNCSNDRIGISIDKSAAYIASILGCWLAKKTFIPIDKKLPLKRKEFIVKDANVGLIIGDSEFKEAIDEQLEDISDINIEENYPAYIIYTSGTTGKPKGVLVSHNGIVNLADSQIEAFKVDSNSKYLFYLSINFDASISDISVCLLSGATLIIENGEKLSIASTVPELIKKRKITHMDIPPSLLKLIDINKVPDTLETIVIGGEACNTETVKKWANKVNLINVYGPTEATVCTSLCKCTPDWTEPILGKEIRNIEYKIISPDSTENQKGELLIAGVGLALGYINNEELTNKKFIIVDEKRYYRTGDAVLRLKNGDIKFLGRIDRQVKIRGQLVELEEIETKLNSHFSIVKSCVLKRKIFSEDKENLVAFVETDSTQLKPTEIQLKEYLTLYLPKYMIPIRFEFIDRMPLTPNGKVNQDELLKYKFKQKIQKTINEKLTKNEEILVKVFKKVTGVNQVSVDDSFWALGGDSLGVIETIFECDELGLKISPELLIEKETPRKIAKALKTPLSIKLGVNNLKSDIIFNETFKDLPNTTKTFKNALITGATGFLGSTLLCELLQNTDYIFYCLVRAESEEKGYSRICDTFKNYNIDLPQNFNQRVKVICGDIGFDNFGLDKKIYKKLAKEIDVVYHCAAKVNMIQSYEQLKNINLIGTKRVLNFCCTDKKKQLHYASTLSVFVSTDYNQGIVYENDTLDNVKYIYGGYGQTKFVAEKYLLNVPKNICDIFIYRFGLITGDSKTGISAKNDFLGMFIKGAKELKSLPKDESNTLAVDITPIDYASKVMALISMSDTEERIFHIANPSPLKYNDFTDYLKKEKIINKVLEYNEWKILVDKKQSLSNNEQATVLSLCRLDSAKYENQRYMDLFQATNIQFDNKNTKSITDFICPIPDKNLIRKYIKHEMQK